MRNIEVFNFLFLLYLIGIILLAMNNNNLINIFLFINYYLVFKSQQRNTWVLLFLFKNSHTFNISPNNKLNIFVIIQNVNLINIYLKIFENRAILGILLENCYISWSLVLVKNIQQLKDKFRGTFNYFVPPCIKSRIAAAFQTSWTFVRPKNKFHSFSGALLHIGQESE